MPLEILPLKWQFEIIELKKTIFHVILRKFKVIQELFPYVSRSAQEYLDEQY